MQNECRIVFKIRALVATNTLIGVGRRVCPPESETRRGLFRKRPNDSG